MLLPTIHPADAAASLLLINTQIQPRSCHKGMPSPLLGSRWAASASVETPESRGGRFN